jgi:hypothetical protein
MRTFGWSVEYVLSLTYPQFWELTEQVLPVRADEAIDIDYSAYCAGNGRQAAEELFRARGKFTAGGENETSAKMKPLPMEAIAAARERAHRMLEAQRNA